MKWETLKWGTMNKTVFGFFLYIFYLPLTPISFHFSLTELTSPHQTNLHPPPNTYFYFLFNVIRVAFATLLFPTSWPMSEHNIHQRQLSIEQYRIFKFININRYIQNGAEPRNSVKAEIGATPIKDQMSDFLLFLCQYCQRQLFSTYIH